MSVLLAAPELWAAGEAEQRLAQSLFERGRTLLEAGNFSEACPLFEESQRLDPGGGTLLNLALCHEKAGRIATAYAEFNEALSAALRDGRSDREQLAREHIRALKSAVPHIELSFAEGAKLDGLSVEIDGVELPQPAWGVPTPVDPGSHEVRVSAPGYEPWRANVEAQRDKSAKLEIPRLQPAANTAVEPAPKAPRPTQSTTITEGPAARTCPSGWVLSSGACAPADEARVSTASWVVGASGVVMLGAGVITGIVALYQSSQNEDAASAQGCLPDRGFCPSESALSASDEHAAGARTLAWISTGLLIAGSGALVTALLLPRESRAPLKSAPSRRRAPALSVNLTPSAAALSFSSCF